MLCIVNLLEKNLNPILLPIWHHPPLFEIKFNCQIELKLVNLEEMVKVRNFAQFSLFHKSISMGILSNYVSPNTMQ